MKSRFSLSKAWVLPLILLLTLLALLFFQQGTDQPPAAAQSSAGQPRAVDTAAIKAFGTWLADGNRTAFTTEGIELAKARRAALKELIQIDPEAALGFAVPYALRRGLPREISSLLETPVSTTAELSVEIACGGPGGSGFRRQWATLGNERIRVFTYGRRAEVMTKTKLSVHGIAIDDVMAMRDDPLREWSPEEVADNGRTGRIAQLGNRLFEIESDEAIEAARRKLRETEELIGPMALPAYRELALGGMDGMFPVAMQNGDGDDDLPSIAYSPYTEGAKTMLYIRARFADEDPASVPVNLANAQANQAGAEAFWQENSYGKSTLTTTYTDVVTLQWNGGAYVNNFGALLTHARNAALAANPGWDTDDFDFYTIVTNNATNNQGQSFPYIGIAQLGFKGSHLLRNFISVRTASHEFGHNLGLNHSEYWLTDSPLPIGRDSVPGGYTGDGADDERIEYGHKFAVMGSQDFSGDFENGRAHYTASDKNRLDWLVAADGDLATTTTSGTFRLYRHDVETADFGSMTPGVARTIKIDLPASDPTGLANPYKYWLNHRVLPTDGIANLRLRNGLQVDWRRDGNGFRSVLLDMTPYSRDSGPYGPNPFYPSDNDDKEDGVLLIGRTFSDTGADIHFTPIAKGGENPNEWLDVAVNIGTQGNNAAPVISNFTVTNPTPATGEVVNFAVTASDPDGDTLAYHWDMGDNTVQAPQLNKANRGKQWETAGYYVVRAEVSDMKGGKTTVSEVIRVGSPADNGMIHGRVTHAGRPVEGALVRGGGVDTWTDSDGSYVLAGLPLGNTTVTAAKDGLTFTSQFSSPVQLTASGAFGIDFTANEAWAGGGGTVANVSPFRIEVPLGFATQFTAQAFDGSGNPIAFSPTWSVTGGGVINGNGVFEAQSPGGPFVVTAEDGPVTAVAEVTVVDNGGPPPANGIWANASGGSWATAGNWNGNTIAAGTGNTADFSTLNPTADTTVTLDAERSIGHLIFGDTDPGSAATWFLTNGTGGSLLLAGTNPTITVNPLGTGKFANIGARLSGFGGFTKNGGGNLILSNSGNTLAGPVAIQAGSLQLNSASLTNASGVAINAGSLVVATSAANPIGGTIVFGGGDLRYNLNPGTDLSPLFSAAPGQQYRIGVATGREVTFGSNLPSPGGSLTKSNPGTLTLASANSYSGGTTITGGILNFGNAGALGAGAVSFTGNATLQAGGTFTLANDIGIASGVTATLDTNGNNTALQGTLTGSGTLTKTGGGTLNISGGGSANNLSGPIHVNAGTLAADGITPSPGIQSFANMDGEITVAAGACFDFSQSFTEENLDNDITLSGSGANGLGALNLWRNATATGAITLAADATISHTFNTATISGTISGTDRNLTLSTLTENQPGITVSGPILLGNGGITVAGAANSGGFSVRLSGSNSYSGETRVAAGTLMLSGNARLHDGSTVRIDSGAVLHLDFTGTDTVAALSLDGVLQAEGTYGSLASTATNKSAAFSGNGILHVGTAGNYATWAAAQSPPLTGGPDGDDDNDGVKNLLEYALVDGGERGVLLGSTITFTKRGAPYGGDLTYIIETSETLGPDSWTPAATHGPAELEEDISHTFVPAPPFRQFVRLKVVASP